MIYQIFSKHEGCRRESLYKEFTDKFKAAECIAHLTLGTDEKCTFKVKIIPNW